MAARTILRTPDLFDPWFNTLGDADQDRIVAAVNMLAAQGPALRRPLVGSIETSQYPNMKELRPTNSIRILFAFDPNRDAILLLGGDKRGQWSKWYRTAIPEADARYAEHLADLERSRKGTT